MGKIWLITGSSRGLGRALTEAVLALWAKSGTRENGWDVNREPSRSVKLWLLR
jgi:NAD(P)-dependent dehydrogenase (short-subunit alcohol dehydrogenase family)